MYKVTVTKDTASVMLTRDGELIDNEFINKSHFNNDMTEEELKSVINKVVKRNKVTSYEVEIN